MASWPFWLQPSGQVQSKVQLGTPKVRTVLLEAGRGRPASTDLETPRPRGARIVNR